MVLYLVYRRWEDQICPESRWQVGDAGERGLLVRFNTMKIMPLPNEVIIYPAHGAGSACGKIYRPKHLTRPESIRRQPTMLCAGIGKQEFITEATDTAATIFPLNR